MVLGREVDNMANGIGTIHVRKSRGTLKVIAMGKTNTGQNYIKATSALTAKTPADPKFKSELAIAVNALFAAEEVAPQ